MLRKQGCEAHSRRHLCPCVEIIPNSSIAITSRPFVSTLFQRIVMTESSVRSKCVLSPVYILSLVFVCRWNSTGWVCRRWATFNRIRKIERWVRWDDPICTDNSRRSDSRCRRTFLGNLVAFLRLRNDCTCPSVFQSHAIKRKRPNFVFYGRQKRGSFFQIPPSVLLVKIICMRARVFARAFRERQGQWGWIYTGITVGETVRGKCPLFENDFLEWLVQLYATIRDFQQSCSSRSMGRTME